MAINVYKTSFGGGEISPAMYGRVDDAKTQTGLARCRNFIVEPQGPVRRRGGFKLVNKAKYANKPCALIPFTFSVTQTVVLEIGDKYIRFHSAGGTILNADGQPYEIETPYSSDDVMDLEFCQSNDIITLTHVKYPPKELRRYGALDWRLVDIKFIPSLSAPTGVAVTTKYGSSVEDKFKGLFVKKYVVTACNEDDSEESASSVAVSINCTPTADGAYNTITWKSVEGADHYRVYRSEGGIYSFVGQTDELSMVDDNISADSGITPPKYDNSFSTPGSITNVTITNKGDGYASWGKILAVSLMGLRYSTTATSSSGSSKYPIIRAKIIDKKGEGSGATVRVLTETSYSYADVGAESTVMEYYYTTTMTGVVLESQGQLYQEPALRLEVSYDGKKYSSVTDLKTSAIDSIVKFKVSEANSVRLVVSDSTGSGAELTPVVTDGKITHVRIESGGSGYTNPTITAIDSGEGSGATFSSTVSTGGDYPGCVTYFEQRRCFAGTPSRPQHIWMTKTGTESNMSYSLPTQATDRISIRVAAQQANRILHLVPMAYLLLLTADAEWRVSPLNSDAITPDSISVRPQSYVGASKVQPALVNNNLLYAASRGGHLRELGYNYQAGGYVTADISLRAAHLFDNLEVKDLTFSKAPYPILYAVSSNGDLIAYTYVPEQQVGAFSVFETQGQFEACCCVSEGNEDVLYCVIRRYVGGEPCRYIERMSELIVADRRDYCFLDCAGTYSGEPKTEISGLTWLEGEEVSILADGYVVPNQTVKDGKITLDEPAQVVHVGLSYTSELQTVPAAFQVQDGSFGYGHRKNITAVTFRLNQSAAVSAGPSFDMLREMPARGTEPMGTASNLFEGEKDLSVTGLWNSEGQICVSQSLPLPIRISSITIQLGMT